MPTTTERPAVDISDRAAALERFTRVGLIGDLIRELEAFEDGRGEESFAPLLEWVPGSIDDAGFDPLGEETRLFSALFPDDISTWASRDADPSELPNLEYELSHARRTAMTARLLVRIAEHPDWLRERAAELLLFSEASMEAVSEALAAKRGD